MIQGRRVPSFSVSDCFRSLRPRGNITILPATYIIGTFGSALSTVYAYNASNTSGHTKKVWCHSCLTSYPCTKNFSSLTTEYHQCDYPCDIQYWEYHRNGNFPSKGRTFLYPRKNRNTCSSLGSDRGVTYTAVDQHTSKCEETGTPGGGPGKEWMV